MKKFSVPLKLRGLFKNPFYQSMNSLVFVFCHIPRTGGSSIWHQIAKLSGNGLNTYDLFHETGQRYGGDLNFTRTVLSEDCNKLAIPMVSRLVVHHHIHIRIRDIFQVRRPVYFTYIRDPLSRFISDLRWNVRLFHEGKNFFDQVNNRDQWSPFLSGEKPLIDLLQNDALIKPYLSFYLNWFWGLMNRDNNDIQWKTEFDRLEKLAILDFVRTNFVLIGFELESLGNKVPLATASQNLVALDGISERARFHEKLAALLGLQAKQLDSELHYRGTVSRDIDSIPGLMDPAFLDTIKNGMKDDYWLIEELRKMRLKGRV
ncbi:MAG: sulfotransferase family protein [Sulfuricella sp.]|nr:sulfotransferase family protein [Sulfuricella sp.]